MTDCIFCKIVAGDIPASLCYEDDHIIAFADIEPQAPVHKLIIPKQHIARLIDLTEQECAIVGRLQWVAAKLAKDMGFADSGFRTVMNCNDEGGQTVYHIHCHLLAGRQMQWPPG